MAIRTIREIGDPVLNKISKEVTAITPRIKDLIGDMFETMYEANGVGLAAPQVTYIMHDLKERGISVDTDVTTVKEAADEIMKALEVSVPDVLDDKMSQSGQMEKEK